jgi:methylmalonyl-CoA mutase
LEIARLRAIRLVWNQMMQDYSIDQEAILMAEIGPEVSHESAYQNMISFSIGALSAAIGGANMIMIQNLEDEQLSESTQSRIPRNMQHLLQLESHLDKVSDPAAGSYLLDTLTQKIASEAWAAFLEKVEQPSS